MTESSKSKASEKSAPSSGVRRVSNKRKPASENPASPKDPSPSPSTHQQDGTSQKRTNRRRRNKTKSAPKELETIQAEQPSPSGEHHTKSAPARTKLDPEAVAKKAWKIFLAEISEEGVALISDNDAKELSHRCFRLAEIFLEQENRRT